MKWYSPLRRCWTYYLIIAGCLLAPVSMIEMTTTRLTAYLMPFDDTKHLAQRVYGDFCDKIIADNFSYTICGAGHTSPEPATCCSVPGGTSCETCDAFASDVSVMLI